eukprot:TRINITY_DN1614_c0_g1_i1.p1 TRINITY_DN1614_c0_g1~~TRINITY_DN1614_c0_g1_i1.p1  ORF type:complete len:135 (+),score=22.94 TRINITY_DN1614_c0_g1_i1:107-511(+)
MKKKVIGIIGLACLLASGIVMNFLACSLHTLQTTWWPMFSVVFYILAPLPNLFVGKNEDNDPFATAPSSIKHIAMFLTGGFIVSGLALPLVLGHAQVIGTPAMSLALVGGVTVYGSIIAYLHFFHKKTDDDFEF